MQDNFAEDAALYFINLSEVFIEHLKTHPH